MITFASLGLQEDLLKALTSLGFEEPTPVQAKVIPVLLESTKDLVALAQTGTGKTAAFGLPVIQKVDTSSKAVQALILCPTRELCLQICRDLKLFSKHMPAIRTVAIYGGTPIYAQLKSLQNGVHIIVATPGRMHDILRRGKADLSKVRHTVLDEADEMLNMGFEEDLKAILSHVSDASQCLLFSATMPRQIKGLTGNYMTDPDEITIGTRNLGAENVTHECYMVHARDRYLSLKRIVDFYPHMYGLIFCRTRIETQDVAAKLMKDGYSADALHGDLSQQQRDRVMGTFRDRSIQMLVATDVAARGIDINSLTHVINYQLPDDLESYTHRSGRTGRAGKTGVSVVLIHMREQGKIRIIEKRIGKKFERKQVPTGAQVCEAQLYHLISRAKDVEVDDKQIDPYLPEINKMLEGMSSDELVKRFVSLEFNRFLSYYRDAPDLNVSDAPKRERIDGNVATLFVNLGRQDNFSPKDIMGMLNRGSKGSPIQVGRIDIKQKCAFFGVAQADQATAMKILNGAQFGGRTLRVEAVVGGGGGGSRGGSRGGGGRGRPDRSTGGRGRAPQRGRGVPPTSKPRGAEPQQSAPKPASETAPHAAASHAAGPKKKKKKNKIASAPVTQAAPSDQKQRPQKPKPSDDKTPEWARNIPKTKKKHK